MLLRTKLSHCVILAFLSTVVGVGTAIAQSANTAYGNNALNSNTTGDDNSAFGETALFSNTAGSYNTAVGYQALYFNTTGKTNIAVGDRALLHNTSGKDNTASGELALSSNTTGNENTGIGDDALVHNTIGYNNTAVGAGALFGNTTGFRNNVVGSNALYHNTTGDYNDVSGYQALYSNTTGSNNSASGVAALYSNTIGSNNVAVGPYAGYYSTTGSNNIEIGNRGVAADNAVIRIGSPGTQKATYMAGVRGVNVNGGVAVMVSANGQLGVVLSSRRYKEDIRSMGKVSDRLLQLRPVTFRYKQPDEKGQKAEQYGLIAEEVAKVMPELVVYNEKRQPETVAYQALVPLLLNELQREHAQIVSQAQQLAALKSRDAKMDTLQAEVAALRRAITKRP